MWHSEENGIGRLAMNKADSERYLVYGHSAGNGQNIFRVTALTSSDARIVQQQLADAVQYRRARFQRLSND